MQGPPTTPKAPLGNNSRPLQDLHYRTIRTNIDFRKVNSLLPRVLPRALRPCDYFSSVKRPSEEGDGSRAWGRCCSIDRSLRSPARSSKLNREGFFFLLLFIVEIDIYSTFMNVKIRYVRKIV